MNKNYWYIGGPVLGGYVDDKSNIEPLIKVFLMLDPNSDNDDYTATKIPDIQRRALEAESNLSRYLINASAWSNSQ